MKTEWIVTETSPYSGEDPVVTAYRSVKEAREAVEREICKLLAACSPARAVRFKCLVPGTPREKRRSWP
ncbi:MAG: hypothetical protein II649_02045 [Kiritimatiellae bacterium]|nr:hypothetical protein [Kiritimatiellia bacterium]